MEKLVCGELNQDLSENVNYNNPLFPAYIREGLLSRYPDYSAMSHWHEDFEFIAVLEGSMTYNVNGQLTRITAGNGIFVNSRQLHYGFSPEKSECVFLCILLHPSLLSANAYFSQNYVEPLIWDADCPYLLLKRDIGWQREILSMLEEIFAGREREFVEFTVQQHFFAVARLLYEHCRPGVREGSRGQERLDTLKQMILYIHEHYQGRVGLDDIARAGSCCRSKCTALFKQYLKESPVAFLNQYRLQKSCDLLRGKDSTVTEVALDCGFHSSSYFCEIFHRAYGITPQQYRKSSGF